MNDPLCIEALEFGIKKLISDFPPLWRHPLKRAVHERVKRDAETPDGTLRYTRWSTPSEMDALTICDTDIVIESGFYTYGVSDHRTWHVNFADPRLFVAYGSGLLAQDELQVMEHPVLGSLREALLEDGHTALTREDGQSTPVQVMNAPRQCAFDVMGDLTKEANASWWRKLIPDKGARSLYGNAFQQATKEEVLSRTAILHPSTSTNLVAIAAPLGGRGAYTQHQLKDTLETAYAGFRAAVLESKRVGGSNDEGIVVHTGWWGCGAFGGNKTVMATLQMLAAQMAGVKRLVFHWGHSPEDHKIAQAAKSLQKELREAYEGNVAKLLAALERRGFSWGTSDRN